MENSS
jgi:hypothetical protein